MAICAPGGSQSFLQLVKTGGLRNPFEPGVLSGIVAEAEGIVKSSSREIRMDVRLQKIMRGTSMTNYWAAAIVFSPGVSAKYGFHLEATVSRSSSRLRTFSGLPR